MHRTQNLTLSAADTDNSLVVTPADTLRGAACYLEIHGFNKADYYAANYWTGNEPFSAACVVGAIGMAAHGTAVVCPILEGPNLSDCTQAVAYLIKFLIARGDIATGGDEWTTESDSLFGWNDRYDQTAETVIAALHAAADQWLYDNATEDDLETYADICASAETHPDHDGFLTWLRTR